jgi:hypothetical protein
MVLYENNIQLFHSRIPRYIFFLTLNPKVLGAQLKLYIVYNLHLK